MHSILSQWLTWFAQFCSYSCTWQPPTPLKLTLVLSHIYLCPRSSFQVSSKPENLFKLYLTKINADVGYSSRRRMDEFKEWIGKLLGVYLICTGQGNKIYELWALGMSLWAWLAYLDAYKTISRRSQILSWTVLIFACMLLDRKPSGTTWLLDEGSYFMASEGFVAVRHMLSSGCYCY